MVWPPTLDELKTDMKIDLADTRPNARLTQALDAAVDYVQRVRPDVQYDPLDPDQLNKKPLTADHLLGTMRLAARWDSRRRSQDGLITMAEMGATRVSTGDVDIDRMLRLGKHGKPKVA